MSESTEAPIVEARQALSSTELYELAVRHGRYDDPLNPNGIIGYDFTEIEDIPHELHCPEGAVGVETYVRALQQRRLEERYQAKRQSGRGEGSEPSSLRTRDPTQNATAPFSAPQTASTSTASKKPTTGNSVPMTNWELHSRIEAGDEDALNRYRPFHARAGQTPAHRYPKAHPSTVISTLLTKYGLPENVDDHPHKSHGHLSAAPPNTPVWREDVEVTSCDAWGLSKHVVGKEVVEMANGRFPNLQIRDNAFLLHGLLSTAECDEIIGESHGLLQPVDAHFVQSYRSADRAILRAPVLAGQLFRRILPHLRRDDYFNRMPLCFGQKGVWVPFGLNECIKINKYDTGGLFSWHRDGPWLPREDQGSIYTVVIYLNEDFLHGETSLLQSHINVDEGNILWHPSGQRTMRGLNNTFVLPTTGTALLFNHDCWHAGAPVAAGTKWILRTELIFQRVHSFHVDKFPFVTTEAYQKMTELYRESQRALFEGRRTAFTDLYQEVVQLQRNAMMQSAAEMSELGRPGQRLGGGRLNADEFANVLSFMEDRDLVTLLLVSQALRMEIIQSPLWETRCLTEFPMTFGFGDVLAVAAQSKGQYKSTLPLDWYTFYVQRRLLSTAYGFQPVGLLLRPNGVSLLTPANTKPAPWNPGGRRQGGGTNFGYESWEFDFDRKAVELTREFDAEAPMRKTSDTMKQQQKAEEGPRRRSEANRWRVKHFPNFFGPIAFGYPLHINMPDDLRWELKQDPDLAGDGTRQSAGRDTRGAIVDPVSGDFRVEVIAAQLNNFCELAWHPLLLVGYPTWFEKNGALCRTIGKRKSDPCADLFELTRTPAIRVVHPAQAIVASWQPLMRLGSCRPCGVVVAIFCGKPTRRMSVSLVSVRDNSLQFTSCDLCSTASTPEDAAFTSAVMHLDREERLHRGVSSWIPVLCSVVPDPWEKPVEEKPPTAPIHETVITKIDKLTTRVTPFLGEGVSFMPAVWVEPTAVYTGTAALCNSNQFREEARFRPFAMSKSVKGASFGNELAAPTSPQPMKPLSEKTKP